MSALLRERSWPEPKLYIAECNQTGRDLEDFMDSVCTECIFPTCTLRD
jgi:hypothetical protein